MIKDAKRERKYEKGNTYTNIHGSTIRLIEKYGKRWTVEEVTTGHTFDISPAVLPRRTFKTPACRTVYGIGYLGSGEFICRNNEGVMAPVYCVWSNMIKRCYTKYGSEKEHNPLYENTKVCDEWHNYQVFAEWYTNSVKKFLDKGEIPKIDKDLLSENFRGTLYSPETCVILPNVINCALIQKRTTNTIHNGVHLHKSGLYVAEVMSNYERVASAMFKEPEDAISFYITSKTKVISDLAEQYKDLLSDAAYKKLKNWKPRSISIE